MRRIAWTLLLAAAAALALPSARATDAPESAPPARLEAAASPEGSWTALRDEDAVLLQFFAGGRCLETRSTSEGSKHLEGTWRVEGETLTIASESLPEPRSFHWALRDENHLVLTDRGGAAQVYDRVARETPAAPAPGDSAHPEDLVGEWRRDKGGVQTALVLDAAGRFARRVERGALTSAAEGAWRVADGRLVLEPQPPAPDAQGGWAWRLRREGPDRIWLEAEGDLAGLALSFDRVRGDAAPLVGRWSATSAEGDESLNLAPEGEFDWVRTVLGELWWVRGRWGVDGATLVLEGRQQMGGEQVRLVLGFEALDGPRLRLTSEGGRVFVLDRCGPAAPEGPPAPPAAVPAAPPSPSAPQTPPASEAAPPSGPPAGRDAPSGGDLSEEERFFVGRWRVERPGRSAEIEFDGQRRYAGTSGEGESATAVGGTWRVEGGRLCVLEEGETQESCAEIRRVDADTVVLVVAEENAQLELRMTRRP